MCNLYSQTLPRDAVIKYFRVSHNRAAAIKPKPAIYPADDAPVGGRAEDGERELVELSWGFVPLMKDKAPRGLTMGGCKRNEFESCILEVIWFLNCALD